MNPAAPSKPAHLKALTAIVLLAVLGAVCIAAGLWQLDRAHQREALRLAIDAGRKAPATRLDARHRDAPDWHPALAQGQWAHEWTVLLDNRNDKGRPGFWVATPLLLDDTPETAVLILRGWMPRPEQGDARAPIPAKSGSHTVRGTVLHHVPRLFDLGTMTGQDHSTLPADFGRSDDPPRLQNLSIKDLAAATGLDFLPVVIEQEAHPDSALEQDWPGPSLDYHQNYNYAMQWFSFAAIALIAALLTAWRHWRRCRRAD